MHRNREFSARNRELNQPIREFSTGIREARFWVPGWAFAVNGLAGEEADGSSHAFKVFTKLPGRRGIGPAA